MLPFSYCKISARVSEITFAIFSFRLHYQLLKLKVESQEPDCQLSFRDDNISYFLELYIVNLNYLFRLKTTARL